MLYSIQSVGASLAQIPVTASRQLINIYNYLPNKPSSKCLNALINRKVSVIEIAKLLKTPAKLVLLSSFVGFFTGGLVTIVLIAREELASHYHEKSREKCHNELNSCIRNNNPERAHELLISDRFPREIIRSILPVLGKWAIENDHQTVLADLLDLEHPARLGDLLRYATENSNTETLQFLIDRGIDLPNDNIITRIPNEKLLSTPLLKSQLESFKLLFNHFPEYRDQNGQSFLHIAVQSRNHLAVEWLSTQTQTNINARNYSGNTALHLAVRCLHPNSRKIIEILLSKKELEIDSETPNNETALMLVCKDALNSILPHSYEIARLLLENRADPNYVCGNTTPFLRAIVLGLPFVKLFLEFGADVNKTQNLEAPILQAIRVANRSVIKYISQEPNFEPDLHEDGSTLLHEIARIDREECKIFEDFATKNDPSAENDFGETPLHIAIKTNRFSMPIVWYYCREQKDLIDKPNSNGETPLYLALTTERYYATKIAEFLAEQEEIDIQKTYEFAYQSRHPDKEQHLEFLKNYMPAAKHAVN